MALFILDRQLPERGHGIKPRCDGLWHRPWLRAPEYATKIGTPFEEYGGVEFQVRQKGIPNTAPIHQHLAVACRFVHALPLQFEIANVGEIDGAAAALNKLKEAMHAHDIGDVVKRDVAPQPRKAPMTNPAACLCERTDRCESLYIGPAGVEDKSQASIDLWKLIDDLVDDPPAEGALNEPQVNQA